MKKLVAILLLVCCVVTTALATGDPTEFIKAALRKIGVESSVVMKDMDKNGASDVAVVIISNSQGRSVMEGLIMVSAAVSTASSSGDLMCDKTFVITDPNTVWFNNCSTIDSCMSLNNAEAARCLIRTWSYFKM